MARYCMIMGCIVALGLIAPTLPVRADPQTASNADDSAMVRYGEWARGRPELREGVPHSVWSIDLRSAWRLEGRCVAQLAADGVSAHRLAWTPTAAPDIVVVDEVPGGVTFHKRRRDAPFAIACALARRLPRVATLLREHGVRRVEVLSAYRREPAVSFHTLGLALDLTRFWDDEGEALSVLEDWRVREERTTCAQPESGDAERLHNLACAMAASRVFSTVITPNYGRGHDDHFHVDIRPDDPWHFLR